MASNLKWHVFVHVLTALYQLYNLCMSHRTHHETILHSRHILQLTSLANICVNIAVRTISHNQTCGELKTWLARNKLQKLRTHHANWHRIVFLSSMMLIPLYWCSTLLHSFSHALCGVSFLWSCNKQYARGILSPPGKTCRWWPSSQVFR